MKKYLLVLVCVCAVILSGCGSKKADNNTESQISNKNIETIAENLVKAALKDDVEEMTRLGNELEKENVKPKEIIIDSQCAELIYIYENKEQKYKSCK